MKFTQVFKASKAAASYAHDAQAFRNADKRQVGRDVGRFAYGQGVTATKDTGKTFLKPFETIPRTILRGLQFIFAIAAIGIYGNRVDADRKENHGFAPEWLFAVIIGGLSAITSVVFLAAGSASSLPIIGSRFKVLKTYRAYWADLVLFVSWIVVFAIFHIMFHDKKAGTTYKGASVDSMKAARWVDVTNAVFWTVSGAYGAFKTCGAKTTDSVADKGAEKMFGSSQQQQQQHGMYNYPQAV